MLGINRRFVNALLFTDRTIIARFSSIFWRITRVRLRYVSAVSINEFFCNQLSDFPRRNNFSLLPLDLLMTIPLDCVFATLSLRFGLAFLFILNILLLELEFWLLTLLLLVVGFDFMFLLLPLVFVCLLLTLLEDNLLVFMVHIW